MFARKFKVTLQVYFHSTTQLAGRGRSTSWDERSSASSELSDRPVDLEEKVTCCGMLLICVWKTSISHCRSKEKNWKRKATGDIHSKAGTFWRKSREIDNGVLLSARHSPPGKFRMLKQKRTAQSKSVQTCKRDAKKKKKKKPWFKQKKKRFQDLHKKSGEIVKIGTNYLYIV